MPEKRLTPKELGILVAHHAPALHPYYDHQRKVWVTPSYTLKNITYAMRPWWNEATGTFVADCDCPAVVHCKHAACADELGIDLTSTPLEPILPAGGVESAYRANQFFREENRCPSTGSSPSTPKTSSQHEPASA